MSKIVKEVTSVTIEFAANGFVVDYSGRDAEGDWTSTKQIFNSFSDLAHHLQFINDELSEYK